LPSSERAWRLRDAPNVYCGQKKVEDLATLSGFCSVNIPAEEKGRTASPAEKMVVMRAAVTIDGKTGIWRRVLMRSRDTFSATLL
jgi:hypothetical protein